MPRRSLPPVPKLTPRQKKVYAHLCRKIRFPLIYGHAQGCYDAINDAMEELHGSQNAHPSFAVEIDKELSKRAVKILTSLDVSSVQHLIDYEWHELLEELQSHPLFDVLVGLEVQKARARYLADHDRGKK